MAETKPLYLNFAPQNDDTVRITWSRESQDTAKWDGLNFWIVDFDQVITLDRLTEHIAASEQLAVPVR